MPYKSDAQRRYFHAAEKRGDISHKTVAEFDRASKGKKLPEKKGMWAGGYADGGLVSPEDAQKIAIAMGMPKPKPPEPKPQQYFEGGPVMPNDMRYKLQDKMLEKLLSQIFPDMGSEDGSKATEHHDSPMPSEGYDRDMTVEVGDDAPQPEYQDSLSRQMYETDDGEDHKSLMEELRKRKSKR